MDDKKHKELQEEIAVAIVPTLERMGIELPPEFRRQGSRLEPRKSLRLWRALLQLREELIRDNCLASIAERDPSEVARTLDFRLLELRNEPKTEEARLRQMADCIILLNSLTPSQQQRVLDLTSKLPPLAVCTWVLVCAAVVKVAVAVQNTNAAANANAGANVNCLSNANGCFEAAARADHTPMYRFRLLQVRLPDNHESSEFSRIMREMNLSLARQKELLRRTLMGEGGMLGEDSIHDSGRGRYTFSGVSFEVLAHLSEGQIIIDKVLVL